MTSLAYLVGKTVSRVDGGTEDDFALIHFTDGTSWLVLAEKFDWGARLKHRFSYGHHLTAKEKEEMGVK